MQEFDHYQILGISRQATAQEIRAAYRKLVKITHPDRNPTGSSNELFQKVQTAYDTLSNPTKRNVYDSLLRPSAAQYSQPSRETTSNYQRTAQPQQQPNQPDTDSGLVKFAVTVIIALLFIAGIILLLVAR